MRFWSELGSAFWYMAATARPMNFCRVLTHISHLGTGSVRPGNLQNQIFNYIQT